MDINLSYMIFKFNIYPPLRRYRLNKSLISGAWRSTTTADYYISQDQYDKLTEFFDELLEKYSSLISK